MFLGFVFKQLAPEEVILYSGFRQDNGTSPPLHGTTLYLGTPSYVTQEGGLGGQLRGWAEGEVRGPGAGVRGLCQGHTPGCTSSLRERL